jgi:hypothetical protein
MDPADLPVDVAALCRTAGLRHLPEMFLTDLASPAVLGLLRPRLLVPAHLMTFAPRQVTWILLHELAHIRRRDPLVAMVQRLLQIAYFFNPAVWLANWAVDQLREYACDDAALSVCSTNRRDCGEGFLNVALRASGNPILAATPTSLLNRSGFIRRRLVRILDGKRRISVSLSAGAVALLLALGALMIPNVRAAEKSPDKATAATPNSPGASTQPADQPPSGPTNLVLSRLPVEFIDYYCVQTLAESGFTERQPFCKSDRPIAIRRLEVSTGSIGFDGIVDESRGTGSGYDTLYVLGGDGKPCWPVRSSVGAGLECGTNGQDQPSS